MDNHDSQHNSNDNSENKKSALSIDNKVKKELQKVEEKTNKVLTGIHDIGEIVRKNGSSIDKEVKNNLIKAFEKQLKVLKEQLADVNSEIEKVKLF
jgi:hypothetical protein